MSRFFKNLYHILNLSGFPYNPYCGIAIYRYNFNLAQVINPNLTYLRGPLDAYLRSEDFYLIDISIYSFDKL